MENTGLPPSLRMAPVCLPRVLKTYALGMVEGWHGIVLKHPCNHAQIPLRQEYLLQELQKARGVTHWVREEGQNLLLVKSLLVRTHLTEFIWKTVLVDPRQ